MLNRLILPTLVLLGNSLSAQEPALNVYDGTLRTLVQIKTQNSASTGFVVRPDGIIVTAFHVINGATRVTVTTSSGEIFDNVSLLAKDARRDLAIIKVPDFDLPSAQLGNSNTLHPGQHISVIGSRMSNGELYASITDGIVSSIGNLGLGYKVIQITAPIPSGTVGGPVVNDEGETIALAVFKVASGEGLNSAIPINYVRGMLGEIGLADPITRWESRPVLVNPWEDFFRSLLSVFHFYPWLIAILVVALVIYLCLTFRYWLLSNEDIPRIAPISVKGRSSKEFGAREAMVMLEAHFSELTQRIGQIKSAPSRGVDAIPSGGSLSLEDATLVQRAPIGASLKVQPNYKVDDELVVEIGTLKIPVGAIAILFKALFARIPMFFREEYLCSLIHISLIRLGSEVQLVVNRGKKYITARKVELDGTPREGSGTKVIANAGEIALLQDAVFMLLQLLDDRYLPGRNWLGKKYFVDGLDKLEKSRRIGNPELTAQAIKSFCRAAEADGENHEALYIHGATLVAKREVKAIAKAQEQLTRALRTDKPELRALVHAALANSYAQQRFRLARRQEEVLKKAQQHIKSAYENWEQAGAQDLPHPWILATDALVGMVGDKTPKQLLTSADLYLNAIKAEPDNGTYYNALGWILLQLAEGEGRDGRKQQVEIREKAERIPPWDLPNVAEKAEYYLHLSLEHDPNNKLSHANLCLVYATEQYRSKEPQYLDLCREHGEKAIELDNNYVHGYRDLAKSLLLYKQFDEALPYFEKALQRAPGSEKRRELIDKMQPLIEKIPEEHRKRWPSRPLLELPKGVAGGATRVT